MTPKELTTLIATAKDPDVFNSLSLTIKTLKDGDKKITGISTMHEFAYNQSIGWSNYNNIPEILKKKKDNFSRMQDVIEIFIKNNLNGEKNDVLRSWSSYLNNANQLGTSYSSSSRADLNELNLFYNYSEVPFLIEINRKYGADVFNAAHQYFITKGRNSISLNTADSFKGIMFAYEFQNKDSVITERRRKERQSLDKLRNDLSESISGSKESLNEFVNQAKIDTTNFSQNIDALKSEKDEMFTNWFKESKNTYKTWFEKSNQAIGNLESLYEEKLRLSEPVKYWNDRADKMNKRGKWFTGFLVGLIVLACIILLFCISQAPQDIISKMVKGNPDAIKWGLSSITILSFLAYGIRSLNKLMFSSFHLARDAEERAQLTYVYLALNNEKAIDEKERTIVLQALFSRADTGLLKEDSSPTMPGAIIERLAQK